MNNTTVKEFYKEVLGYMETPDQLALDKSMDNVHGDGLFSLVVAGEENGKLTRIFIANKKVKPFQIQLHSHRYAIKLAVLKGAVTQHNAKVMVNSSSAIRMPMYNYQSPLNGGAGLSYLKDVKPILSDFLIPVGSILSMGVEDIHTISCSKGSMWIVQEQGFEVDSSWVLGVPFKTDGLYTIPKQFQVNSSFESVLAALKDVVAQFDSV